MDHRLPEAAGQRDRSRPTRFPDLPAHRRSGFRPVGRLRQAPVRPHQQGDQATGSDHDRMTASTTKTPEAEAPAPAPLVGGGRRARADTGFQWLSLGAAVLVLAILLGIVISMTSKAWPAFSKMGLSYFTEDKID